MKICGANICDAHTHVGHFRNHYYTPHYTVTRLKKMGVQRFAISSSSTTGKPWSFVCNEYERVLELAPKRAVLLLWVTPEMLAKSRDLRAYDQFPFRGIKLHGFNGWKADGRPLRRIFSIARERGWPVKFHTGGHPEWDAGRYRPICQEFPEVNVILAHGRPFRQAVAVMKRASNAWVDTSFMPMKDVCWLVLDGRANRLLFGSDFPAPAAFYKDAIAYCRSRYRLHALLVKKWWRNMAEQNFSTVFGPLEKTERKAL